MRGKPEISFQARGLCILLTLTLAACSSLGKSRTATKIWNAPAASTVKSVPNPHVPCTHAIIGTAVADTVNPTMYSSAYAAAATFTVGHASQQKRRLLRALELLAVGESVTTIALETRLRSHQCIHRDVSTIFRDDTNALPGHIQLGLALS